MNRDELAANLEKLIGTAWPFEIKDGDCGPADAVDYSTLFHWRQRRESGPARKGR